MDVSRLIWRLWRRGLPTGIDRVCLAYVEYFRGRSLAVIQRRGHYFVLSPHHSDLLFDLLYEGPGFRSKLVRLVVRSIAAARRKPPRDGLLYLNVGHTGLDEPSLKDWTSRNRIKAVYLIHDLIPLLYPEYCRAGEEGKHRRRMETVLASAHGLIANSHATSRDLAAFATERKLPMPPITTAWIAGSPPLGYVTAKTFHRPHFVVVGTIEARKNHALLLHIWKKFAAEYGPQAPILVIVGQRGWEASSAIAMLDRSVRLEEHVVELGNCDDETLISLIMGARALLMPSFAEGFGLPVAEALEMGTPVIASDLPVFREFAGDIPEYLDPLDGLGWAEAIMDFTRDSAPRERQLRALDGYRAPNWRTHFEIVDSWLQTLS